MPDPEPPTGSMKSRFRSPNNGRASRYRAVLRVLQHLFNSVFARRYAAYVVPLLLLWVCVNSVLGCGTGTFAFDGGHIPTGGTAASVISGTAFAAEDYSAPIAGATVTATNTSITGPRKTQTTTTAADGSFTFNGFPDTSNPIVNLYQVSVSPPAGSNRVMQQINFPVNAGQSAMVLVAMPQISFNESVAASVTILHQVYQLHSGDTVEIGAELLDLQGSPLPVSPSLVFTGNFGVLSAGGLFTSTKAGVGSVTAYWNIGSVQLHSSMATISANTSTPIQPPPPPPPITGPATVPAR